MLASFARGATNPFRLMVDTRRYCFLIQIFMHADSQRGYQFSSKLTKQNIKPVWPYHNSRRPSSASLFGISVSTNVRIWSPFGEMEPLEPRPYQSQFFIPYHCSSSAFQDRLLCSSSPPFHVIPSPSRPWLRQAFLASDVYQSEYVLFLRSVFKVLLSFFKVLVPRGSQEQR